MHIFKWLTSTTKAKLLIDDILLSSVAILIAFGVIMVYSASIAYATSGIHSHNQYYFVIRHIIYIGVGISLGFITFNVRTSFWQKHAIKIFIITIIVLLAVLIPHIGRVVNGSRRWIGVGLFNIQPSELAKLGTAIFFADYVAKKNFFNQNFWHDLAWISLFVGSVVLLLLLEPDMGSASVVFCIVLAILFMSEIDRMIINTMLMVGILGGAALVIFAPYRLRRVTGFWNPWHDAFGKGYQLTNSLLAVGHGQWIGVGLGNSIEKLHYLPEAHTDFILAIIAEETGLIGVGLILLLFCLIFYRGFTVIANKAKLYPQRKFQAFLAQAISLWFLIQALVNAGVVFGALPTKGLTLPFISYGGSSIVVSCIAVAVLLKIDYENKLLEQGVKVG